MINFLIQELAWEKMQGLLPAIVQDHQTSAVLMLGYMNIAALEQTIATGLVTFYSRSKNKLWTKGETSGNYLKLTAITTDCDKDTLLISANPTGPVCHTGTKTCFGDSSSGWTFIRQLEDTIAERESNRGANSYTAKLFDAGIQRIAQKVGEEGVEVALASIAQEKNKVAEESADLLYHLFVLLRARDLKFMDVVEVLKSRHK